LIPIEDPLKREFYDITYDNLTTQFTTLSCCLFTDTRTPGM
jgi:hypothetical protein